MMYKLILLALLLILGHCHDPHYASNENIYTIVTGLFDSKTQNWDTQLSNLRSMTASDLNLIVVTQPDLISKVPTDAVNNKTLLLSANVQALGYSWLQINSDIISKSTQKMGEGNALDYTRMLWLNFAQQADKFDTDEFIWVDLDHFQTVKEFFTHESIDRLVSDYKHHFFIETLPRDQSIHAYPGAEQTYFNTNITTFVGKKLFGGRRESIETISVIYDDIMRVALYVDHKTWSEQALLTQLAHRAPFLISYLTISSTPTENRLLTTNSSEPTQEQLQAIENAPISYYTKLSYIIKIIILLLILLILFDVLNLVKLLIKKRKVIEQSYNTVSEVDSPRAQKSEWTNN